MTAFLLLLRFYKLIWACQGRKCCLGHEEAHNFTNDFKVWNSKIRETIFSLEMMKCDTLCSFPGVNIKEFRLKKKISIFIWMTEFLTLLLRLFCEPIKCCFSQWRRHIYSKNCVVVFLFKSLYLVILRGLTYPISFNVFARGQTLLRVPKCHIILKYLLSEGPDTLTSKKSWWWGPPLTSPHVACVFARKFHFHFLLVYWAEPPVWVNSFTDGLSWLQCRLQ